MKKRILIAVALLVIFSTITPRQTNISEKLNLKKIIIENNSLLKKEDIKILLAPIYNENLLFLDNNKIEKILLKNKLIESFIIKKKYPNTLVIKIFEKKPIAILFNKNKKFYLSEKIELIEYKNLKNFQNLPYVFGNEDDFKIFYNNLASINFPLNKIKKYTLYETGRWDLETKNNIIIKLPVKNYIKSLNNFLNLKNEDKLNKFSTFDYRINDQLILK